MHLETQGVEIANDAPLLLVDVDEVIGQFMAGFERFLVPKGFEMRITRFALFESIFALGSAQSITTEQGLALHEAYFRTDAEFMDPVPGAAAVLAGLAGHSTIVILTNAPVFGRDGRQRWLARQGFPYPMVVNSGPKGPMAAVLAAKTRKCVAFIDDLLPNLDSVADAVPGVRCFQHVADERLRPFAYSAPDRHPRIDDWSQLGPILERALGI